MKLLLAIAAVAIAFPVNEHDVQTGSLATAEILSHGYNLFSMFPFFDRYPRATPDTLKESIEKMEMIARLTNVIYLQQGLTNATIKPDVLIPELLNFGSVTLADINSLDSTKIETALNDFKGLPSKLKSNTNTQKVEEAFRLIGEILKEMEGITTVVKWDGKDQFKTELEKIKQGKLGAVSGLDSHLRDWIHYYGKLKGLTSGINVGEALYLTDLKKASRNLINDVQSSEISVFKFDKGEKAIDQINVLLRVRNSINFLLEKSLKLSGNEFDEFETNVNQISGSVSQMDGVVSQLDIIRKLFFSLSHPFLTSSQVTAGMPHGYDDVGKVSVDMNNKWLKAAMKNGTLAKSYPSVQSLGTSVAGIQKKLGAPDDKILLTLSSILEEQQSFKVFKSYAKGDAKAIAKTVESVPTGSADTNLIPFIDSVNAIDTKLNEMKGKLKSARETIKIQVGDLTKIADVIEKMNANDHQSVINTLQEVIKLNVWDQVKTSLDQISLDLKDLKSSATITISKLGDTETYQTKVSRYFKYIDGLIGNAKTSEVVANVKASKAIRESSQGLYGDGLKYAKIVIDSKSGLKSLESAILSANGTKTLESSSLNLLGQADVHTQVLGLSTRAVVNMKTLLDKKGTFDVITKHSDLIKNEKNKYSGLVTADQTLLDNLATLGPSIDKMFIDLDAWKVEVEKLTFSNLEDYSNIFAKAKNVQGLSVDVGKMNEVVGKLIGFVDKDTNNLNKQNTITSLKEVQNALETLDELQFSKYSTNFDKTKSSLSTVDLFFADYLKEATKKIAAANAPKVIVAPGQPSGSSGSAKASDEQDWIPTVRVIGIAAAVLLVLGATVGSYCCYKKCRDPEEEIDVTDGSFESRVDIPPDLCINFLRFTKTKIYGKLTDKEIQSQTFEQRCDSFNLFVKTEYLSVENDMKENKGGDVDKLVRKDRRAETRQVIELEMKTRILVPVHRLTKKGRRNWMRFRTSYLHGNIVFMRNKRKLLMVQGPMLKSKEKKSTVEKTLYAIVTHNVTIIVMLCNFVEDGDKPKCDIYFPLEEGEELKFKGFTLRCVKKEKLKNANLYKRQLVISYKDREGEKEVEITHYQYTDWPDQGAPRNPRVLADLWRKVGAGKDPVMIHCSAGIGRTGSLGMSEQILQDIYYSPNKNGNVDFGGALRQLRKQRSRAIQTENQFAFSLMMVFYSLFEIPDFLVKLKDGQIYDKPGLEEKKKILEENKEKLGEDKKKIGEDKEKLLEHEKKVEENKKELEEIEKNLEEKEEKDTKEKKTPEKKDKEAADKKVEVDTFSSDNEQDSNPRVKMGQLTGADQLFLKDLAMFWKHSLSPIPESKNGDEKEKKDAASKTEGEKKEKKNAASKTEGEKKEKKNAASKTEGEKKEKKEVAPKTEGEKQNKKAKK